MTTRTLHKCLKMGMMPGDVSKQTKISMLENKEASISYSKEVVHRTEEKACKIFKKVLRSKERARMKEKTRSLVNEGI